MEERRAWMEQMERYEERQRIQLEQDIAQRTASIEELPLYELFADKEGEELVANAVEVNGTLLLPSELEDPSSRFWGRPLNSSQPLEIYVLQSQSTPGPRLLLSEKETKGFVETAILGDVGNYDLQLVSLDSSDFSHVQLTLGQVQDGQFSIPLSPPLSNAVALLETSKGFLPVGIYDSSENKLLPLSHWGHLDLVTFEEPALPSASDAPSEEYYVLETPFQQLVFSNIGGALAEVNLPFEDESNELSIVKEVQFDRVLESRQSPKSRFPSHPYLTPDKRGEHSSPVNGGYYPLLRRAVSEEGLGHVNPQWLSLAVTSQFPEVAELVYEVKSFDSRSITFEATQRHRRITKTFTLPEDPDAAPYCFDVKIRVDGDARGLWLTSGVPEVEWVSGAPVPEVKYQVRRQDQLDVETVKLPGDSTTMSSVYADWICNSNGFFGIILDPQSKGAAGLKLDKINGESFASRAVDPDSPQRRYQAKDLPGYLTMIPLSPQGGTMEFRVFAGPLAESVLKQVDATYSDPSLGYTPNYWGARSFHGWFRFISQPFARFLFVLMTFFHKVTDSWGWSIILLTIVLRILLYPLNAWSMKSMSKMKKLGPELQALQEKYKKDPKRVQLETMNLYRERGVNPLGGCFPMLIQMPFLIGMFDLLKSTFELRGASFIPGWIDDLTAPDVIFSWKQSFFLIGNELHLLPILLGAVMFLQARVSSPMPTTGELTDQQRQQKAMSSMMTVVFTVLFYNFASGLNLYFFSSMLLGIAQQWFINRSIDAQPLEPVVLVSKEKKKKKKKK